MGAVGRHEVVDRFGVLESGGEFSPAAVRREAGIKVTGLMQLPTHLVKAGHAQFAGPGDVDSTQVEGQAHQVVVQCPGDELVDVIALLAGHPAEHFTGSRFRR